MGLNGNGLGKTKAKEQTLAASHLPLTYPTGLICPRLFPSGPCCPLRHSSPLTGPTAKTGSEVGAAPRTLGLRKGHLSCPLSSGLVPAPTSHLGSLRCRDPGMLILEPTQAQMSTLVPQNALTSHRKRSNSEERDGDGKQGPSSSASCGSPSAPPFLHLFIFNRYVLAKLCLPHTVVEERECALITLGL